VFAFRLCRGAISDKIYRKARVKKMALVREEPCDADLEDRNVEFGAYGKGPEEKYIFQDRVITITGGGTTDQERGFVATFANTGLVGTADYYDPVGLGKPVIGNFVRPTRFDWKRNMTSVGRVINSATTVTNSITFRLLFLLYWKFPDDIVLGSTQFQELFLENSTGNRHQAYLYPDVKEKCVVLYDCNHTMASPVDRLREKYGNVAAAAGGQAAYVVPPNNEVLGWAVPAATVPATTTTEVVYDEQRYGGHQLFLSGSFDLTGVEGALWRDPNEAEENQIVPSVVCFVVCQDLFHYYPASQLSVGQRPTTNWQFYCRYAFTDQ